MAEVKGSEAGSFSWHDFWEWIKPLLLLLLGEVLTWGTQHIGDIKWGWWSALIITGWTALAGFLSRFVPNTKTVK